jgi:hypothetical protein
MENKLINMFDDVVNANFPEIGTPTIEVWDRDGIGYDIDLEVYLFLKTLGWANQQLCEAKTDIERESWKFHILNLEDMFIDKWPEYRMLLA